jgi:hypothetical protein
MYYLRTTRRILLGLALFFLPLTALAHDHVSRDGSVITWYDGSCCNNHDCAPVVDITPMMGGMFMKNEYGASAFIAHDTPRRPSKDMRWHICVNELNRLICVYEPPSASLRKHFARSHD